MNTRDTYRSPGAGRLQGRTAIVVGAGSQSAGWGNGKAAAVTYAREGARVLCADLNPEAAGETAAIIEREGGTALALAVDATDSAAVQEMAEHAVTLWGRIDVLHHNVGLAYMGDVVALDEADWDAAMKLNVKSAFLTMKFVIPQMIAQGGGVVTTISSLTAQRYVGVDYASYYASKAALSNLTKATAAEFASKGVRVNTILPGLMRTPLVHGTSGLGKAFGLPDCPTDADIEDMWKRRDAKVPMGFMGDAFDVAKAAAFLASDDARYITGIELIVDGGLSLGIA